MSHDPLCPVAKGPCCPWMGECDCQCLCDLIARVREDERGRIWKPPIVCMPCWYGQDDHACINPEACRCGVCVEDRIRAAALRDAVEAVKALTGVNQQDDPASEFVWRRDAVAAIEVLNRGDSHE